MIVGSSQIRSDDELRLRVFLYRSHVRSALFLVVLCACGDNVTGLPFEDFDDAVTAARCARFVRCGMFVDDAACDGFFRKRPDLDLELALKANVVGYSGPAAEECVDALASQSCDTSARDARLIPEACARVFIGTRAANDDCALDEECGSGSCVVPSCGALCCRGTCSPNKVQAGAACELDEECRTDLFCGRDGTCQSLVGEGDLCDADNECDYGLACIGPSDLMSGNCRAQPRLGEMCLYQRCADLNATCRDFTCVALGLPGAACTTSDDCSDFAACDQDAGTCVELPRLGEPCDGLCAGEAWCDLAQSQRCLLPQPNSNPCFSNDQCETLFCEEGPIFDTCAEAPICF